MLLRAITTPTDAPPPPDVLTFARDGVTLWASDVSGPFTKEDMLEHHRVVCDIFARVDACLPMRFPTLVDDVSALEVEGFAERLRDVRHACELGITAVWRDTSPPATGRAYLLRRVRAQRISEEIQAAIGEDLIAAASQVCPSRKVAISLAVLVRRDAAETVKSDIPRSTEDVRILVHGPWPPYTFADGSRLGTRNASA